MFRVTITIAQQTYATTKYNGVTQPTYSIAGTGTINNSGAYPVWDIKYDLIQGGTKIAVTCILRYHHSGQQIILKQ